jgi:hypothetical protein
MRQLFLPHLVGHVTTGGPEVASGPAVSPPRALFQPGQFLAQLPRGASLAPAHACARGHVRRGRDEHVPVILAHHPLQELDLEELAGLPHHLASPQSAIAGEHLGAVLGHPYAVLFDVRNRMPARAIVHSSSPVAGCGGLLERFDIAVMTSARLQAGV